MKLYHMISSHFFAPFVACYLTILPQHAPTPCWFASLFSVLPAASTALAGRTSGGPCGNTVAIYMYIIIYIYISLTNFNLKIS